MITNTKNEILGFTGRPKEIKKIAFQVINVLQNYKRGDVVVALSILWITLCERFDVRLEDILTTAYRLRNDTYDNKWDAQFVAIKEYMKHEL